MPIDTEMSLTLPAALFGEPMQPPGRVLPFPDPERANRERAARQMRERRAEAARTDATLRLSNALRAAQATAYERGDRDARRMLRGDKWFWLGVGTAAGLGVAVLVINVVRWGGWL